MPVSAQEFARRTGSDSLDLAVQGRDGRWLAQPFGPNNYFAGGGGVSVWVEPRYEQINEDSTYVVNTDLVDGYWEFIPTGFSGQQAKAQNTPTTESRLRDATNLVRTALQRSSCSDLFGENVDPTWLLNSLSGGLSRLGNIEIRNVTNPNRNAETTGLLGPPTYNLQRDGTFRAVSTGIQGARITINSNPQASFNAGYQNPNGSQRFGVSDDINRAITLIHELGHAANFIYGEGSSRIMQNDDTPTGIVSLINSLRVYRACFEAVR
jgi:hypothetical protein